jgi:broad specificity phosphatase PhoE
MPTKLILIRHGQTSWNREKKYCGAKDIWLDATGKVQARKLAARLKNEPVDIVYSSNRRRALQTARLIFGKVPIKLEPGLREIHFGVFEGMDHHSIMKKYPLIYKKWLKDPFVNSIPRGESLKDFRKRIVFTIKKIISLNKGKTIAAVCHGGAISVFINHILKSRNFWEHIPSSASISVVEYVKNKPKIIFFNDIKHL